MSGVLTFRQSAPFSCFINCYAMARSHYEKSYEWDKEKEFRLMNESFRFDRECYEPYLISKLKKDYTAEVFVESPYLERRYHELSEELEEQLNPVHKPLHLEDYREAARNDVAIVLLDKWHLDMYTHFAHWVLLSDYTASEGFTVNDSWTGKEMQMPEERLQDSVRSLRERLRCSPVIIRVGE